MVEGHVPQGVWVQLPPSAQKTAVLAVFIFRPPERNLADRMAPSMKV